MERGLFITFEGGEGGGKTTQINKLSNWMKERGIKHVLTKEPGCPHIDECQQIRKLLLNPENDLSATAELLLFLADRAQHVSHYIRPNLEEGIHVLCDRYSDSTRVYQCARGLSRSKIDLLLEFATGSLDPDLTFILDLPVEIGLNRAKAVSTYKDGDRMEKAGIRFHEDVRHGFLRLAEEVNGHRFRVVDVAPPRTVDEINEDLVGEVSKKLWGTEETGSL